MLVGGAACVPDEKRRPVGRHEAADRDRCLLRVSDRDRDGFQWSARAFFDAHLDGETVTFGQRPFDEGKVGSRVEVQWVFEERLRALSVKVNDVIGVAGFTVPGARGDVLVSAAAALISINPWNGAIRAICWCSSPGSAMPQAGGSRLRTSCS